MESNEPTKDSPAYSISQICAVIAIIFFLAAFYLLWNYYYWDDLIRAIHHLGYVLFFSIFGSTLALIAFFSYRFENVH